MMLVLLDSFNEIYLRSLSPRRNSKYPNEGYKTE